MRKAMFTLLGAVLVTTALVSGPASSSAGSTSGVDTSTRRCQQEFERALQAMNENFVNRNLEPFLANYGRSSTFILFDGTLYDTPQEIRTYYTGLFANPYWVATFTKVRTVVNGCDSAVAVEEGTFDIPAIGYALRYYGALSWVREHGRWRVVLDHLTTISETSLP